MLKIDIQKLLSDKNKTRYWLIKQMDTSYDVINNMIKGAPRSIRLENIEKLCDILECTPNDLFVRIKDGRALKYK